MAKLEAPKVEVELSNCTMPSTGREMYFHAINSGQDLREIALTGFKSEFWDEGERMFADGNLGVGVYLTKNWRISAWFGTILVDVAIQRGTKILDASIEADQKILNYLVREFGKEILTTAHLEKVLPKNKRLTESELVELFRYHYQKAWHKDWGRTKEGWTKFTTKRMKHHHCLRNLVSKIKNYKFDGYGNPNDDNGILIFEAHRVKLQNVLGVFNRDLQDGYVFRKA